MAKKPGPDPRIRGRQVAQQVGVPWNIFNALVQQESGWQWLRDGQVITSPAGAIGYGQLMPGTARGLGVDPYDPDQNLTGAARYLAEQYKKFGRWDYALAAYNAGPGAVAKYGGVPPYSETQNYVKTVMANARAAKGAGSAVPVTPGGAPPLATPTVPPLSASQFQPPGLPTPGEQALQGLGIPTKSGGLGALLNFAAPTDRDVSIRERLGGSAGSVSKGSQTSIPTLAPKQPAPPVPTLPTPIDQVPATGPAKGQVPVIPVEGQLNGRVPMVTGGNIAQKYPNLQAQSQVDWQHVNPRLLGVLQKLAEKRGVVIVINSGYRSEDYNQKIGGAKGSNHRHGTAVDAYINGHPIGEVFTVDELAKVGLRSGNVPGFFKGKPDPMHVDLVGMPVK